MSKLELLAKETAEKEFAKYRQVPSWDMMQMVNPDLGRNIVAIFNCREVKGFPLDKEINYHVVPGCMVTGKGEPYFLIEIKARGRDIKLAFSFSNQGEFLEALGGADALVLIYGKAPQNVDSVEDLFIKSAIKGGLAIDNKQFLSRAGGIIKMVMMTQVLTGRLWDTKN